MFLKIYFGDKPVFLCDEIDTTIHEYMHHPDAVYIDEIAKPEFHAGILWNKDIEKLKMVFFKHFQFIQTGGGLIINENKEILMILRRGKWDLPKGKLDKGETLKECAVREVHEETGLKNIIVKNLIATTYHTYTEFGKHILKESHWFNMLCRGHEPLVAQAEEDITDIRWVKEKDLEKYLENTFATIKEVLGTLNK